MEIKEFKVIKEYCGLEVGTIQKCKNAATIRHMTNQKLWKPLTKKEKETAVAAEKEAEKVESVIICEKEIKALGLLIDAKNESLGEAGEVVEKLKQEKDDLETRLAIELEEKEKINP